MNTIDNCTSKWAMLLFSIIFNPKPISKIGLKEQEIQ